MTLPSGSRASKPDGEQPAVPGMVSSVPARTVLRLLAPDGSSGPWSPRMVSSMSVRLSTTRSPSPSSGSQLALTGRRALPAPAWPHVGSPAHRDVRRGDRSGGQVGRSCRRRLPAGSCSPCRIVVGASHSDFRLPKAACSTGSSGTSRIAVMMRACLRDIARSKPHHRARWGSTVRGAMLQTHSSSHGCDPSGRNERPTSSWSSQRHHVRGTQVNSPGVSSHASSTGAPIALDHWRG
jgi:hypothetical protein